MLGLSPNFVTCGPVYHLKMGEWDLPHRVVLKSANVKHFAQCRAPLRCSMNIRLRPESTQQLLTEDS